MGWLHGRHLLVLASTFLCSLLIHHAEATTFPGDIEALRQLKAALDPASVTPGSCLGSWDFAADPCDALFSATHFTCGFRCDARDATGHARVTDLSLDAAGYSGPLSPAVWSLPFLQTLDAPDNRLSGPIPSPPPSSDQRQLRRVTLSRNALSGWVPVGDGFPSLEELYLDGNLLSGPVPATLRSLRRMEVQMNNLSGGFPDLSAMARLAYFDASDNAISGRLPPGGSLPASLVELTARSNALEGTIPHDLVSSLPSLQVLDLGHNRLSGRVPAGLFAHPALQQLTLSYNQFTSVETPRGWWLGPWWARGGLVAVDLGHNRLAGGMPMGWVRGMPRLTALSMEGNLLTGVIPTEYAARVAGARVGVAGGPREEAALGRLMLAGNYLYGPIPSPLTGVEEGEAAVSLADNCLFQCPDAFFFCRGGEQKRRATCRDFNPVIP